MPNPMECSKWDLEKGTCEFKRDLAFA